MGLLISILNHMKNYRVRYRIDGVLSEIATPPMALKDKIAAQLKWCQN